MSVNFPNIACCLIIRTNHLSEPPLVLISSDNRRSTVYAFTAVMVEALTDTLYFDILQRQIAPWDKTKNDCRFIMFDVDTFHVRSNLSESIYFLVLADFFSDVMSKIAWFFSRQEANEYPAAVFEHLKLEIKMFKC